jgi:hypothetical protein
MPPVFGWFLSPLFFALGLSHLKTTSFYRFTANLLVHHGSPSILIYLNLSFRVLSPIWLVHHGSAASPWKATAFTTPPTAAESCRWDVQIQLMSSGDVYR